MIGGSQAGPTPAASLASLLDASPDAVLVADAAGRVLAWNRAMQEAAALTADAMADATVDTIDACLAMLDGDHLFDPDPDRRPTPPQNIVTGQNGRMFERVEQTLALSATGAGRILWFRPVDLASETSDAERRQLRAYAEQRRQALRMEAVGRLAGGIAHDFNNMLTVMIGFAEQLRTQVGERESLTQVVRAAHHAADLTRQLLAFSRQQVLKPRVVDVSTVVSGLCGMVDRLIGDDVQLEIDAPEGLPRVCADPAQLEQIVLNLAINARDAMPRGGRLAMAVRRTVLDAPRPGRAAQPAGEYVQLSVADTGTGIAPDVLNKIFEPFFTTKGIRGTGPGLSTVYGIVKQSGGFIWVDSRVGSGTTFTIELPITSLPIESVAPDPRPCPAAGPESGCILVVEDLEAVRMVTQEMLEADGYEVIAAATPREAIDVMQRDGHRVDLVLSDMMMPEMTGRELSAVLRSARPQLPVLFMSGLPKSLERAEPGTFLPKPFTRAALLSHVRARLAAAVHAA